MLSQQLGFEAGSHVIASIFIICASLILLAYWGRYVCILLLRDHDIATDQRFSFGRLEDGLRSQRPLDELEAALRRDHQVIAYLLENTTGVGPSGVEQRLLLVDYRLMQWWYRLTRVAAPDYARAAVREMGTVLSLLACQAVESGCGS